MISNALKNCPVEKIICQTECDLISHVVRITVINPLNYQDLKSPKANGEGTKAVLQLCADAFGGQAPRFNLCNEAGVDCPDSPDCNPTHWVAEVSFPFGINKGNTPWITRYTNSL